MEKSQVRSQKSEVKFRISAFLVFSFVLLMTFDLSLLTLYAMDVNLFNLPVPAGTEVVYQDKTAQINGISAQVTHLSSVLGAKEIFNFYQDELFKRDWQIKNDSSQYGVLAFVKEEGYFYVGVRENGKEFPRDVYLVSSPRDLAICNMLKDYFLKEQIAEDTPGKDLPDVPRFPGAKRRMNLFAPEQGLILLYEVEAPVASIAQFYKSALKTNGWEANKLFNYNEIKSVTPGAKDLEMLFFEKAGSNILINIFPVEEAGKKRSLICITKNPQELISIGGNK